MPAVTARYSATQREAIAVAVVDHGIRPATRVCELAAAGKLTLDGETLPPFETRPGTVADYARKLRKRRAGEVNSEAVKAAPRDAVEALRRRLVALADRELAVLEGRKRGTVDPERLRQIARVVRELAALPGPSAPRPAKPGHREPDGQARGGKTGGGLAGALLAAHGKTARVQTRGGVPAGQPVQDTPHHHQGTGDTSNAGHEHEHETEQQQEGEPGSWARAQVQALEARGAGEVRPA